MDVIRFIQGFTGAHFTFIDVFNNNNYIPLVVLLILILSLIYGFNQITKNAKKDTDKVSSKTLEFAIICTLAFAVLIGGMGAYEYYNVPKDSALSVSETKELLKKNAVQLNDTLGVYKVVESFNQAIADKNNEYYNQFLIAGIEGKTVDNNYDAFTATFNNHGTIVYYANKSGFISSATIFFNDNLKNDDAEIIQIFVKTLAASEIESSVLRKFSKDIMSDEIAGIYSLNAKRYFVLSKPNEKKSNNKNNNNNNNDARMIHMQAFVK